EGGRQAVLPLLEEEVEAPVGVGRRPEAGEHALRPRLAPVHVLMDPARVRKLPGIVQLLLVLPAPPLQILGAVVILYGDSRHALELLRRVLLRRWSHGPSPYGVAGRVSTLAVNQWFRLCWTV